MKWLEGCAGLGFICALALGVYLGSGSWDGTVYVTEASTPIERERTPAAIPRRYDFSQLEGPALTSALQNRLLSDVNIMQAQGRLGIELGHFVTRDNQGERVLACQFYNRLEMVFVADGIIESGERPTLAIDSPCVFENNVNVIGPVWIPIHQILSQRPGNVDWAENEESSLHLQIRNIGGVWPRNWSLSSIRLYNSEISNQEFAISELSMRRQFSRLISVSF